MASSINTVTLCGRLGKDPEIRNLNSDTDVARLSVATSRGYKPKDGDKEVTDWHIVVIYGGAVKVVESMRKGDLITLTGSLQHRSYDKDGRTVYVSEVVVSGPAGQVVPCGSPSGTSSQRSNDRGNDQGYRNGDSRNGGRDNRNGGRDSRNGGDNRHTDRGDGRRANGWDGHGNARGDSRGGDRNAGGTGGASAPADDLDDEIPF
jgi:single-strand DNA-binding protein